jgi:hypothetical protein
MTSMRRSGLPLVLAVALAAGCRSPAPSSLDDAYALTLEARTHVGFNAHDKATDERLAASREVVRGMLEQGAIQSADDHVRAAFVLCSSRELDDLELAHEVAWRAAELGDERGLSLAAEALDRALFLQNLPQHFGTQYVYEPVLARWRLYPVDAATTDEEREQFGIPPMAALKSWEDDLNRKPAQKPDGH